MSQSPDPVNHPPHYTQGAARCQACSRPIECIDVIEHMPSNLANATKYIWRCDHKHPDPTEDLRKAVWYLSREIDRRARLRLGSLPDSPAKSAELPAKSPDVASCLPLEMRQAIEDAKREAAKSLGASAKSFDRHRRTRDHKRQK